MKIKRKSIITVLVLLFTGFVSFACTTTRVNLVESENVFVERVHSKNILVSKVFVHQDGDELVVSGRVKRRTTSILDGGYVDIAVASPEGEILEQASTSYVPRIIRRKGSRESFFSVRLSITPPGGSIIRVAYHKQETFDNLQFNCGKNAAAQDITNSLTKGNSL